MSESAKEGHAKEGHAKEGHEGGCLCGAVRFRASGPPLWVSHCHCDDCRRACGAAVATFVGVAVESYRILAVPPVEYRSSPGVTRSFCGTCGTPLTYVAKKYPGEVHIMVGAFDKPEAFKPGAHVFADYRLPWLHLEDGLPSFDRLPPGREDG